MSNDNKSIYKLHCNIHNKVVSLDEDNTIKLFTYNVLSANRILLIEIVNYSNELLSLELPLIRFEINTSPENLDKIKSCISVILPKLREKMDKLKIDNNVNNYDTIRLLFSDIISDSSDFKKKINIIKNLNKKELLKSLDSAIYQYINHRDTLKSFDKVDDFMASLND